MIGRRCFAPGGERGQASVMIGMMIMTFILFFAFVVNTGMLVNAKINLQNAADLAAYSGAATQARQLNQISFLNYEMRRQYKKFLFRYYVMGNMAQDGFPRTGGGGTLWSPDGGGTLNYGVPVVCMIFNASDNFCHLTTLPEISIPPPGIPGLDAINESLIGQLKKIEEIRKDNCATIGIVNTVTLRLWLYNTDPKLAGLAANLTDDKQKKAVGTIAGLAQGLGIVPRELLLSFRLKHLAEYVNSPGRQNVTLNSLKELQNGIEPEKDERTINAFLSAYYTLGNHTFAAGDVVMDELTPDALLTLKEVKSHFTALAVGFKDQPGPCIPQLELDIVKPFPVGYYKDRSVMTYYAVKLKAKAKVMFSPFGTMELKAYAAAQPFGSRIGPVTDESLFVDLGAQLKLPPEFVQKGSRVGIPDMAGVPNLPVIKGEGASGSQGWNNRSMLQAMYEQFGGGAAVPSTLDGNALNLGIRAAMGPNPYEVGLYNMMTHQPVDDFSQYFDDQQMATFWAPLFGLDKAGALEGEVQSQVRESLDPGNSLGADFVNALSKGITTYVGELKKGQGENGEGANYVRIENPFLNVDGKPIAVPKASIGNLADVKSSWANAWNQNVRDKKRIGYSVKFVSFDSLYKNRQKTDGQSTWNNPMKLDAEADEDVPLIRH